MARSLNNVWIGTIRVTQLAARLVQEAYADVSKVCRGSDLAAEPIGASLLVPL